MRQAIVTKYLGPTDCRGARIKATACAGSITVPYDYGLSTQAAHGAAARALADKFGWVGNMVGGSTPDGYCFVFPD